MVKTVGGIMLACTLVAVLLPFAFRGDGLLAMGITASPPGLKNHHCTKQLAFNKRGIMGLKPEGIPLQPEGSSFLLLLPGFSLVLLSIPPHTCWLLVTLCHWLLVQGTGKMNLHWRGNAFGGSIPRRGGEGRSWLHWASPPGIHLCRVPLPEAQCWPSPCLTDNLVWKMPIVELTCSTAPWRGSALYHKDFYGPCLLVSFAGVHMRTYSPCGSINWSWHWVTAFMFPRLLAASFLPKL